jgi:hypothetical protein
VRVCGQEGDPSDASWAAIHQPHVFIAALNKVGPLSLLRVRR